MRTIVHGHAALPQRTPPTETTLALQSHEARHGCASRRLGRPPFGFEQQIPADHVQPWHETGSAVQRSSSSSSSSSRPRVRPMCNGRYHSPCNALAMLEGGGDADCAYNVTVYSAARIPSDEYLVLFGVGAHTCRGVPVRMSPPFQALPFSLVMRCACVMYLQRAGAEPSGVSCAMCLQPSPRRYAPLHSTPLCRAAAAPTCRRSAQLSESRAMPRSHPRMISFLDAWQTIRVFSCTCPCVLWHSNRVRRSHDGHNKCAPLAHPPLGISRGI